MRMLLIRAYVLLGMRVVRVQRVRWSRKVYRVCGHGNWRDSGYTGCIVLQPCFRMFPGCRIYDRRSIYYFLL